MQIGSIEGMVNSLREFYEEFEDTETEQSNHLKFDIMYKDTIVCKYVDGCVEIVGNLPRGLRLLEGGDYPTRCGNAAALQQWCSNRLCNSDRANADIMYQCLGIKKPVTEFDRMQIALMYNCLTLMDCYWIKQADSTVVWKDINLYEHYDNEAGYIALRGECFDVDNIYKLARDLSTSGKAPMAWSTSYDRVTYLNKKGISDKSIECEVNAGNIINCLKISKVKRQITDEVVLDPVIRYALGNRQLRALVPLENYTLTHKLSEDMLRELKYRILAAYVVGDSTQDLSNLFITYIPEIASSDKLDKIGNLERAFTCEDCDSIISLKIFNVRETLSEAVKRLFSQEELKQYLERALQYVAAHTELDSNEYWEFVIKQLRNVLDNSSTAEEIFAKYRSKYNISDASWEEEYNRLLVLSNSFNGFDVARFIENTFL